MKNIKVGSQAPDFSLKDFRGRNFELSDYQGRKNVMLVLIRQFGCQHTHCHLNSLRDDYPKFQELNTVIAVIGQYLPRYFASIWKNFQFPFIGLPDNRERVARLYGQETKRDKGGRLPAIFLIDLSGEVVYANYFASIYEFPLNRNLFPILENGEKNYCGGAAAFLPRMRTLGAGSLCGR